MKKSSDRGKEGNLFQTASAWESSRDEPLAARMRPRTIEDFVGQDHVMGPGRLLRRAIQADMLSSVIFSGPPGTGKTTLARIIANSTRSQFLSLNAVLSGVKEVREAVATAQEHRSLYGRRTILFVDEVHRWNKAQQDALLPWVENGTVILIGATTENPFFEVNSALVSRSRIFQLKPLNRENMFAIARSALSDPIRGYGAYHVTIEDDALGHLVDVSDGDARTLLNALQLAVETTAPTFPPSEDEEIHIDLATAEDSIQRKVVLYDKEGDYHFDTISAFIKSLRGSDPDAALYWMARMVRAGEDPHYLFRRMLISASEDVGLADPMALVVVQAAAAAFDRVGLPEGQFHLTHAALYLATAPKSNSALGYFDAVRAVDEESSEEVPTHLKDSSRDKHGFGHGEGYLYPHAYRDHWVAQAYLPPALRDKTFYHPAETGYEKKIRDEVQRRRELQIAAMFEDEPTDVLTFSHETRSFRRWINRASAQAERRDGHGAPTGRQIEGDSISDILADIRRRLFDSIRVQRHDRVFVFDPGQGNLIWEAVRTAREGLVFGLVPDERAIQIVRHAAEELPDIERPTLAQGTLASDLSIPDGIQFEHLVLRDPFTRVGTAGSGGDWKDLFSTVAGKLAAMLTNDGYVTLAQIIPSKGQRLSGLVRFGDDDAALASAVSSVEQKVYANPSSLLVGWNDRDIVDILAESGLQPLSAEVHTYRELRAIRAADVARWTSSDGPESAYGPQLHAGLASDQFDRYRELLGALIDAGVVPWEVRIAYIVAREKE